MLVGDIGQALAPSAAIVDPMFFKHGPGLRVSPHQIPDRHLAVYWDCHVLHLSSTWDRVRFPGIASLFSNGRWKLGGVETFR